MIQISVKMLIFFLIQLILLKCFNLVEVKRYFRLKRTVIEGEGIHIILIRNSFNISWEACSKNCIKMQ